MFEDFLVEGGYAAAIAGDFDFFETFFALVSCVVLMMGLGWVRAWHTLIRIRRPERGLLEVLELAHPA